MLMVGLWLVAAAQPNLDSLYAVWQGPQHSDSVRANAYNDYIWNGYIFSKPDSAYLLAETLITFGEARDLPDQVARAYSLQGTALFVQTSYAKAIASYEKSLAIFEELGLKRRAAPVLGNMASIYVKQGDYPKALYHLQRSLALDEEMGDKKGIGASMIGVGQIYMIQQEHAKALDYLQRGLAVLEEVGDKRGAATALQSLGMCYLALNDDANAVDHYQRGLAAFEALGDTYGQTATLNALGYFYSERGDRSSALDHFQRGLALATEIGNKRDEGVSLCAIGATLGKMGDHGQALEYCRRALMLADETRSLEEQRGACNCLYDAYKAMGKGNEALEYLERMRVLDDSLQESETIKKLEQMEFNRQMFADSVAKAEEARVIEAAHTEEIRKKNRTRNYLALGGIGLLMVAGGLYSRSRYMRRSRDIISKERDRSDNLLLNILPAEIAAELKEKGRADARDFKMVSILFTDFKGFTEASAKLSAQELVSEINTCFEAFDGIVGRHGIEKIKTIGDAYMAAGGLPVPDVNAARNTVLAGLEMQAFIEARHAERSAHGLPAFLMRVGIHTGPVVAGIVGVKKFQYDIWGDTVNTASRMESSGSVGQVNISEATYEMVKEEPGLMFTARGKVQAKGKGEMSMYFVEGAAPIPA